MVRAPAIFKKSSTLLTPSAGRSGNGCPDGTGMATVIVGPVSACAMDWPDTSNRRPSRVQDTEGAFSARAGPPPPEQKEHNTRVGSPRVDIAASWPPAFAANVVMAITHSPFGETEKT